MNSSELESLAFIFANYIFQGQFIIASKIIVPEKKSEMNSDWLESEYSEIIEYGDNPPDHIEVMVFDSMHEWASKEENDIGWVYVAIAGVGYSEAVALVFSNINSKAFIRNIEWGRP
jgi:hypothetical protein